VIAENANTARYFYQVIMIMIQAITSAKVAAAVACVANELAKKGVQK